MDITQTTPNTQLHHERRPAHILKAALGVAAVATLAAGCSVEASQARPEGRYSVTAVKIDGAEVRTGANVRFDPEVIEDGGFGDTNSCGTIPEHFVIPESFGAITTKPDANGTWVGFSSHTEGLPEECADRDSDGTVWVNSRYVEKANITENQPLVTQLIPRN